MHDVWVMCGCAGVQGSAKCISRMMFRKLFGYGQYSDYMVGFKEIRYMPVRPP